VARGETNTTDAHSSTVDMPPVQKYQIVRRALARRFHIVRETVAVGATSIVLRRPRSAEELISPTDFEHDERLPYWAELWPSAPVLAAHVPAPGRAGARLLELGCGLGLVTSVALAAGWDVVATDYYEDALRFTELNALATTGRAPTTRLVDWRDMPAPDVLGLFDAVVAADVLYERPYSALIASALARTLAPTGVGLIVDPGRVHAPAFPPECEAHGLTTSSEQIGGMKLYHVVTRKLVS
jgi:ETFB lysine methyltransferase